MNDFEEFLNSLPPPPSGPAPKPPRRVSTILSSPNLLLQANPSAATDDRPPMMKKLSRVLNTRRFSKEKKELERGASEADSSLGYHLDAFHGKIGVIQKAISRDKYVVNQYFNYSTSPLLTEAEISNSHYIPPPPLPKLIKLTLKKTVATMTLDQKWLLMYSFADSTLLHYACAGDQYEVVKLLLDSGADWRMANAVNKTADAYTIQESIRELFVDADEKYEPLSAPPPTRLTPALLALQAPTESPPPTPTMSILKPAGSGRRRQSIVNDAQWADSNLRSTVHQAAVLNIRGANTTSNPSKPPQESLEIKTPDSARQRYGGSFRRPDDSAEEEDEGPIATFVPMSFGRGSVGMLQPTTSSYSAAESVHSDLSAALDFPMVPEPDELSVASGLTGTTVTGSVSGGAAGSRMSARRRSRVMQSLRLRGSVTAASTEISAVVEPSTTQEVQAATKYPARRNKSPQKISSVTTFTDQSSDPLEAAPRVPSPEKLKRSKSARKARSGPAGKEESSISISKIDSADIDNTKKERPPKSKTGLQHEPKRKFKPPPPRPGSAEATNTTVTTTTTNTTNTTVPTADSKLSTTVEDVCEEHKERQSAAPPPLRVMRRLSVNMTQHSLEALSYIEGVDGTKQVVESAHFKEQEDASLAMPDLNGPQGGLGRLFTGDDAAIDTEAQKKAALAIVAERGSAAYLEAWECKATDQSPFERLQVSLLTGRDAEKSVQAADALIAKAKALEKQEAREARKGDARAEKLKQMLNKLTPLETIASGVLHGRVTNIVAGAATIDAHSAWLSETQHNEQQQEAVEETGPMGSNTVRFQLESDQQLQEQRAYSRAGPVSTPTRPHSLTYRELIWRRAGQHMNASLSDAHRNEYDRARAEAYQLGVRLLRQEFRSYAHKDRWEAVEFLEEQRMHESERRLLASDKILLSMGVGLDTLAGGSSRGVGAAAGTINTTFTAATITTAATADNSGIAAGFVERTSNRNDSFVPFSSFRGTSIVDSNHDDL